MFQPLDSIHEGAIGIGVFKYIRKQQIECLGIMLQFGPVPGILNDRSMADASLTAFPS